MRRAVARLRELLGGALAPLTSRLVLTTVALVLLVTVAVGVATTLAVRGYLTDQLDGEVRGALARADHARTEDPRLPLQLPRSPGGPDDGERSGDRPGNEIGTLAAWHFADHRPQWTGFVTAQRSSGAVTQLPLSDRVATALADVPADGRPHDVDLAGLGSYRVAVADDGDVAAGLPTSDVDQVVGDLVGLEVLLALLAVVVGGGAALVVVRRQLRPLREVAGTAHRVAELPLASGEIDLGERVPERLTDERTEVGRVGGALNTLLAHVETSLESRHRSEQQVRQFVADASHELRTPLATIRGYTELARRRPGDPAVAGTALGKVEEESGRMTALVEDLLLLARLDAGRPLERRPVDVTRLLLETVSDARVVAPDHHWRLDVPEEALEVTGDELRLHQVVTNLLTNARRYTPAGTTVTVTARRSPGTGAVTLGVHDDGPGFPPELVDHAFERFARGDVARTREAAGGAGLGLSLVQAILTAHGGTVDLSSRPGDTTVRAMLPA